jgi:hypothetical protein
MPVDPELHAPPVTALLNVVVLPTQTDEVPVMLPASGKGFTVTVLVAMAEPQLLLTV